MSSTRVLLVCATVVVVAGGSSCPSTLCPEEGTIFNPLTGECEAVGDTNGDGYVVPGGPTNPPGPGTGGLPTEPDTDTSMSENGDPDAINLQIFGLNGRWLANDNGRLSCIVHGGDNMTSTLLEERACDHQDPNVETVSYTYSDLEGTVSGNTITGTTVVCQYGHSDSSMNGIFENPMMLTISEDGKTLSGTYMILGEVRDFSLTRQTVGNCVGGE